MPEFIYGAGGVLLNDGQVLVITEDEDDERYGKRAGMLSIPMGKVRGEESARDAAEREFSEETGYSVSSTQYLRDFLLPPAGSVKIYIMNINGDGGGKEGILNPRWMPIQEFLALPDGAVRPPSKKAVKLALLWQHFTKDGTS